MFVLILFESKNPHSHTNTEFKLQSLGYNSNI